MLISYNKSWLAGESITPDKLNNYASGVLERLHNKNLAIVKTGALNLLYLSNNTNTFSKYNRSMRVALEIQQGAAVLIAFSGTIKQTRLTGTTLSAFNHLDVLIDESIYLSTLTATPASDGVFKNRKAALDNTTQGRFHLFLTQLEEGVHTFELVGKSPPSGDGTYTHELAPNSFFWVEEYGINIGQLIGANNT